MKWSALFVMHELADNAHQTSCCGNTVCLQCAIKCMEGKEEFLSPVQEAAS